MLFQDIVIRRKVFKINEVIRIRFVKFLNVNITNTLIFFDGKIYETFAIQKILTFLSTNNSCI